MARYFGMSVRESQVLRVLIDSPKELYGFKISELSKLNHAVVYLSLKNLKRSGFITSRAETREEKAGRPGLPRHLHKVTPIGIRIDQLKQDAQAFVKVSSIGPLAPCMNRGGLFS